MARDVKNRIPAFRAEKRKSRKKLFTVSGLLITGLVLLLSLVSRWTTSPEPQLEPHSAQTAAPQEARFSYFRLLEDREMRVSESQISEEQRNIRLGKEPSPGDFSLLIGTFKTRDQAESVRKKLHEFDALKPKMEEITLEFASWYRLKLGPYGNLKDANQVRLFLRNQGIDSIIETDERSPVDR